MKNLQFSDALVTAIERGDKDVTRRLMSGDPTTAACRYRAGDVCYVGEALTRGVLGMALYRRDSSDVGTTPWRWQRSVLPARYCPETCARVFVEIVNVRAERLDAITEEDAKREGVTPFPRDPEGDCWTDGKYRTAFEYTWGEIHGWHGATSKPITWVDNPWVWRVEFRLLASRAEAEELHRKRVGERKRKGRAA